MNLRVCRQCGAELNKYSSTDICSRCAKENLKKAFKQYPEYGKAFKETVEELSSSENIQKMTEDTTRFLETLSKIRKGK